MKRQPGQHGVSSDLDLVPDFVEGEPFLGQLQRISEHGSFPPIPTTVYALAHHWLQRFQRGSLNG